MPPALLPRLLHHRFWRGLQHPVQRLTVLFATILLALLGVIHLQASVSEGLRSFVRAEGLWAKAQKDAVLYLNRYSHTRDESDYAAFLHAMSVSKGDQDARLALLADPPDLARARQGFLVGANHPADIDAMVWLFLNFQHLSYLQQAQAVWEQGDAKMQALRAVASEIRQAVDAGTPALQLVHPIQTVETLHQELLILENSFSLLLGEAARWVQGLLWLVSLGLLALGMGLGLYLSRPAWRDSGHRPPVPG